MLDRRSFCAALACVAFAASAAIAQPPAPKVLLVCQYGSVKSAIARELLRRRSSERHVALAITSRGLTPEEHLPEDLRTRLIADGIDPKSEPLLKLAQSDLDGADIVILFDPLPKGLHAPNARDWSSVPSMIAHYPEARADLDRRIDALLDERSH